MPDENPPDPEPTSSGDLLTVEEVAVILKISPDLVRKYLREGRLRATKVGKFWRIPRREVDALLNLPLSSQVIDKQYSLRSSEDGSGPSFSTRFIRAPGLHFDYRAEPSAEREITHEKWVRAEKNALIRGVYEPTDMVIENFKRELEKHGAHVEVRESPFWEITILQPAEEEYRVTSYISIPGSSKLAIIEGTVDKQGEVRVEDFGSTHSFRLFIKMVLAREMSKIYY